MVGFDKRTRSRDRRHSSHREHFRGPLPSTPPHLGPLLLLSPRVPFPGFCTKGIVELWRPTFFHRDRLETVRVAAGSVICPSRLGPPRVDAPAACYPVRRTTVVWVVSFLMLRMKVQVDVCAQILSGRGLTLVLGRRRERGPWACSRPKACLGVLASLPPHQLSGFHPRVLIRARRGLGPRNSPLPKDQ